MSFPPIESSQSAYSTEQLEVIKGVYTAIAEEPWFTQDQGRRREFATKVQFLFDRGVVVPDKLHALCLVLARKQFAESLQASEADQTDSR
jgi:hypothetical protein